MIAYPKSGIDYCEQLYSAVAELGMPVVEGQWAGRWIVLNVRRGDLVHIHWPSFLYFDARRPVRTYFYLLRFFVLISIIRLLGARIAWTAHNLYPHDGGRARWVHRVARRFISRIAQTIFVHGPAAARIVGAEFNVADKLVDVPHGHWRARYPNSPERTEARRRTRLPLDVVLYGFVGSCRPYKNLESLLAAFQGLDATSHLVVAGAFSPPEYSRKIESIVGTARDRVHLVPRFLADEEIMTYVAALDVLVLSYKSILTSGAAMLALSAGVPVIAPRMGGLTDVVNDTCGLLYDPKAPDGLRNAMRAATRRSWSREAIIAHALSFDWKVSAMALIQIVEGHTVPVRAV
ncbi:MAG TPA: glycosyltransferase family 4 protein [Steroidobacteraceae bacterium]|nr:glycosyltransferase family 4 protein [Steroidobacteraceae bacterium]